jgi:DNA-binding transcriptional regulator YbjK
VVLVAAGIGTRAPRRYQAGRIVSARCYGSVVTLDPTGIVYVRAGSTSTLADLFRSWGQPLGQSRLARFGAAAGTHVAVFVDGRRLYGDPRGVALSEHAEIVLEVGPHVPPHSSFVFPPAP